MSMNTKRVSQCLVNNVIVPGDCGHPATVRPTSQRQLKITQPANAEGPSDQKVWTLDATLVRESAPPNHSPAQCHKDLP